MNLKLKYCLIWLSQSAVPFFVMIVAPYIGLLVPRSHRGRVAQVVVGLALIAVLAAVNWACYRYELKKRARFLLWCAGMETELSD